MILSICSDQNFSDDSITRRNHHSRDRKRSKNDLRRHNSRSRSPVRSNDTFKTANVDGAEGFEHSDSATELQSDSSANVSRSAPGSGGSSSGKPSPPIAASTNWTPWYPYLDTDSRLKQQNVSQTVDDECASSS